ncbi:MAG: UvrD-helicase domain-containing protein [Magnetococcales bacterium]|nr:UvrD-helicase domain-containing protein [Magnetococcales bacterium]
MHFLIADSFTASLLRLTAQEQKAVKTSAFDLQLDPSSPGLSFHRIEKSKDAHFWSVRVNADIRLIVHKTESSLLLCYAGHHDDAYGWAERRKIERHPTTGAAQLVEIRERVEEFTVYQAAPMAEAADVPQERFQPPLFLALSEDELLSVGVPPEWVKDVRNATENNFFDLAEHLPAEASEALLDYAANGVLRLPSAIADDTDPFAHPDALRRFRVLDNVEELQRALDYPWEKWTIFLHPAQKQVVEKRYGGPARISGSAGTGKTIVALHRAVFLARRNVKAKVLLTTFSESLAKALEVKIGRLAGNEPEVLSRITVRSLQAIGRELYESAFGSPEFAETAQIAELLEDISKSLGLDYSRKFLLSEWTDVVDAWQIDSWEGYRDVARLGRKTRLGPKQREGLWSVFSKLRAQLTELGLVTWSGLFARLSAHFANAAPFHFVVVDEAQDVGVAELRFLSSLGSKNSEGLFFAGDLGQRIFQQPFSWRSLGVDIRGRSQTLKINYRTSHQIRTQADRLLPGQISDVDGNSENRKGTISLFDGPAPNIEFFDDADAEAHAVAQWILDLIEDGVASEEVGIFVRSENQLNRAMSAVASCGLTPIILSGNSIQTGPGISIGTMHDAKGLEFRAVAVMACDDEIIPLNERVENVADEADLEEVYASERHLLYVACTRARDFLMVSGVEPVSEFLGDMA